MKRPVTVKSVVVSDQPFGPSTRKMLWLYVTPSLPTKGGSGLPVTGPMRPGSATYFLPLFGYGLAPPAATSASYAGSWPGRRSGIAGTSTPPGVGEGSRNGPMSVDNAQVKVPTQL